MNLEEEFEEWKPTIGAMFLGILLMRCNLSILPTRESQTLVALMFYFYLKTKKLLEEEKDE